MAPKRPSPLDEPPAASSSEEEVASSEEEVDGEEEEESGSGSESESEEPEPPKAAPTPVAAKKPDSATVNSKPQSSSSGSESESESDSELDKDRVVKPIVSKPMEETPKTKKPRSKASAITTPAARAGLKRPSESDPKDSKRPKKKVTDPDQEREHAGEETKKAGGDDSKKLFQRIWSDDDEITILKGMIDYSTKKGADPYSDMGAFHDFIKKSLKADVNKTQLQDKIRRIKKKYETNVAKGKKYNPVKPHEQKLFDLSKKVWGSGEGSIGLSGLSEQSKSNGKARTNQKGNKTLASLKAELLSSPERPKECEKVEFGLKPCGSESLSEVIGFDKGFRELGLPEGVVKQGLELIGGAKRAELKEKWKKLHVAELELFVKKSELMRDQAKPGAFGVVTLPFSVREGINIFLSGFVPTENPRFRDESLTFKVTETPQESGEEIETYARYGYPSMTKTLGEFKLQVIEGEFTNSQIIVMLGENGSGKTTFMRMLVGLSKPDSGVEIPELHVSYKNQKINPKRATKVKDLLHEKIRDSCTHPQFVTDVMKPLQIEQLMDQEITKLSGGELQRVALCVCLGKPADIYLMDEPSAYLDSEQRIVAAKVIKRFVLHAKKTAFVVGHDFIIATYLADKVIVYEGKSSVDCIANSPNQQIESTNDTEQKASGSYYYLDD
ncbi:hypothetical protein PRUPE_3G046700 [Prunus persica]|uniref:ABC transporter domain-containing protein n=1 Tax=Prunus persica TaxID=3760 RepID=A0A251PVI7_PRUPE|nr:hypothetical protein PRUPE_3G046700 [Prunus persica]